MAENESDDVSSVVPNPTLVAFSARGEEEEEEEEETPVSGSGNNAPAASTVESPIPSPSPLLSYTHQQQRRVTLTPDEILNLAAGTGEASSSSYAMDEEDEEEVDEEESSASVAGATTNTTDGETFAAALYRQGGNKTDPNMATSNGDAITVGMKSDEKNDDPPMLLSASSSSSASSLATKQRASTPGAVRVSMVESSNDGSSSATGGGTMTMTTTVALFPPPSLSRQGTSQHFQREAFAADAATSSSAAHAALVPASTSSHPEVGSHRPALPLQPEASLHDVQDRSEHRPQYYHDDDDSDGGNAAEEDGGRVGYHHPITVQATAISQDDLEEQVRQRLVQNAVQAEVVAVSAGTVSASVDDEQAPPPPPLTRWLSGRRGNSTTATTTPTPTPVHGEPDKDPTPPHDDTSSSSSTSSKKRRSSNSNSNPSTDPHRNRRIWYIVFGVLLLAIFGTLIGVIVALTVDGDDDQVPKDDGFDEPPLTDEQIADLLEEFLVENVPRESPILLIGSPQQRAMEYVLTNAKPYHLKPPFLRRDQSTVLTMFALVTLYYSSGGENWTDNTNWLDPTVRSVCDWHGIRCRGEPPENDDSVDTANFTASEENREGDGDGDEGGSNRILRRRPRRHERRRRRDLQGYGGGDRSDDDKKGYDQFPLGRIMLPQNNLVGTIPNEIGMLTNLEWTLNLNGNFLTGTIPSTFHALTRLDALLLRDNQLTSTIPSSIGSMTALRTFDVANNFLTGTVPVGMSRWTNIEDLLLEGTLLEGTVPNDICEMILTQQRDRLELGSGLGMITFRSTCPEPLNCPCCTDCCNSTAEELVCVDNNNAILWSSELSHNGGGNR